MSERNAHEATDACDTHREQHRMSACRRPVHILATGLWRDAIERSEGCLGDGKREAM